MALLNILKLSPFACNCRLYQSDYNAKEANKPQKVKHVGWFPYEELLKYILQCVQEGTCESQEVAKDWSGIGVLFIT